MYASTLDRGPAPSRCMRYQMRRAVCCGRVRSFVRHAARARQASSWSMLHRCIVARYIGASATPSHPAALRRVMRCASCFACAARLGEGRALRWPSGGASCTHAQTGNGNADAGKGGVLYMTRGTALFDAVAISDTEAEVRAGTRQ
jgi:hypothetical protein